MKLFHRIANFYYAFLEKVLQFLYFAFQCCRTTLLTFWEIERPIWDESTVLCHSWNTKMHMKSTPNWYHYFSYVLQIIISLYLLSSYFILSIVLTFMYILLEVGSILKRELLLASFFTHFCRRCSNFHIPMPSNFGATRWENFSPPSPSLLLLVKHWSLKCSSNVGNKW